MKSLTLEKTSQIIKSDLWLTPSCQINHSTTCHIQLFLELSRDTESTTSLSSPIKYLSLFQWKASSSCPIRTSHGAAWHCRVRERDWPPTGYNLLSGGCRWGQSHRSVFLSMLNHHNSFGCSFQDLCFKPFSTFIAFLWTCCSVEVHAWPQFCFTVVILLLKFTVV